MKVQGGVKTGTGKELISVDMIGRTDQQLLDMDQGMLVGDEGPWGRE